MELDQNIIDAHWANYDNGKGRFFIINEAIISKLCILGEDCEPCFEGASITPQEVQFSFNDDFKEQMFAMMTEIKNLLDKGGEKVFTRYSVEIGDSTWNALYNYKETNLENYSIDGIYEEEGQKLAVFALDGKYYRLDFSIAEDGGLAFAAELTELESYSPAEEPQFTPEAIAEYAQNKNVGKDGQSDNDENHNNSEDDGEKCPKCNKPIKDCICKEEKYNLSDIPEYVELENKFSALEKDYQALVEAKDALAEEVKALTAFKVQAERKDKEAMIASFCMLSDEDKEDVIANIDTYSLDDIEAKLSVICFRNKVNFSLDTAEKEPTVVNLDNNANDEDAMIPAWVKSAIKTAKKMN
jgi:hypothetical protein